MFLNEAIAKDGCNPKAKSFCSLILITNSSSASPRIDISLKSLNLLSSVFNSSAL